MISLYEEAIIEDLRYQLGDSRVSIVPPDILFRAVADISGNDQVKLPLVSLSRLGYSFNEIPHNSPDSYSGSKYQERQEDGTIKYFQVQRLPITCRWQLDVINRSRKDNDSLVRELLFYYTNNPTLRVMIPYGLNQYHKFSLHITPDIEDNSDIESHVSRGEYFRTTIGLTCYDANMWKVTYDSPKKLVINYSVDKRTSNSEDSNIPNDSTNNPDNPESSNPSYPDHDLDNFNPSDPESGSSNSSTNDSELSRNEPESSLEGFDRDPSEGDVII